MVVQHSKNSRDGNLQVDIPTSAIKSVNDFMKHVGRSVCRLSSPFIPQCMHATTPPYNVIHQCITQVMNCVSGAKYFAVQYAANSKKLCTHLLASGTDHANGQSTVQWN